MMLKKLPAAFIFILLLAAVAFTSCSSEVQQEDTIEPRSSQAVEYIGSASCRKCHEKFYKLWAPSRHGLAMQPYTDEFAEKELNQQQGAITIGKRKYRVDIRAGKGWVREGGFWGKKYSIEHVMGGKNVYYFLTPMERGRLQVLPLAYDVRKKAWFDTAASGVRHVTEGQDQAVDWTDPGYTFNTSCHSCHVSQIAKSYDLATDTYRTTWIEPGINCESCHGPAGGHVRACEAVPKGQKPKDLKIIITKQFTADKMNHMCATCHAKAVPLTTSFRPGDRFFDHYDLVTLEHPDYYPDGRDLGENYTYTSWLMSPCAASGKVDCNDCHTPSGRMRFTKETSNNACLPCHTQHVKNPAVHTHHQAGSPGNECISCHMPKTDFARMARTDHSMLPPAPSATIRYQSPNACTICHADKDAKWADGLVRKWRRRDYQKPMLYRAGLIDAARKQDWSRLPEMLRSITKKRNNEVYKTSLIRLLRSCDDDRKWPAIIKTLRDPSALVRASAVEVLDEYITADTLDDLLRMTEDDYRLVRVRSASTLASVPRDLLSEYSREKLQNATDEFMAAMKSRPDDWASHYNMGNYYASRREFERAVSSFETATRLEPRALPALVNASLAYNAMGQNARAERSLRKALEIDPDSVAANLNLGLLVGEQGRVEEAEKALRLVMKADPKNATAAYNLCVLMARDRLDEALVYCQKARELRPRDPKYGFTLAFYLNQKGDVEGAVRILNEVIRQQPAFEDAYMLLAELYRKQGNEEMAKAVYQKGLSIRRH